MWRVPVVEDDLLQGKHVCDLLVEKGMEPIGPAPTKAALKLLETTAVDAAILASDCATASASTLPTPWSLGTSRSCS